MIASGMTNSSIPLAENLRKAGYEVDYFQLLFQGYRVLDYLELDEAMRLSLNPQKLSIDNSVYKYLSTDVPIYLQWVLKERKKLEKTPFGYLQRKINRVVLRRFCKKYICGKYDVVNIIAYPRYFVEVCDALSELKMPYFVTFHEILKSHSDGYEILPFVKEILKYNTQIVLHSKKSYNDLINLGGDVNLSKRCSIIYFGPYDGNCTSYGDGVKCVDVKNYLLYVGNILPYKGLSYLYEAVMKIEDISSLKVVIAGGGYDPVLRKMEGDSRFIILNRYVLNEEIAYLVKNCKAMVCPYIGGSQSGVSQLAMAYKKPIIATNVAAFAECIRDGVNGWVVKQKDPEDLSEKIKLLYNSTISNDFQYNIPHDYSWPFIVSQYGHLFERMSNVNKRQLVYEKDNK